MEEARDLGLVGLKLIVGVVDGGALVGGVFQLDNGEGQAVDEDDDVGAALDLALDDGELVDGEPIVRGRVIEIGEADQFAALLAVAEDLDGDAVDEEIVEGAVGLDEGGRAELGDAAQRIFLGLGGGGGIEAGDGGAEAAGEEDVAVVGALGVGAVVGDVGAEADLVAESGEPGEGGFFDGGFGEGCGHGRGVLGAGVPGIEMPG